MDSSNRGHSKTGREGEVGAVCMYHTHHTQSNILLRYRSGCKLELETKEAELAGWEARLKVEQNQQETVQAELRQVKQQVREERDRREEVQTLLHEASRRLVELQRQKEEMQKSLEKVRGCPDHICTNQLVFTVHVSLPFICLLSRCQITAK